MKTLKVLEGKLKEQNPEVCMSLFYGHLRRTWRLPQVLLGSGIQNHFFTMRCTHVFIQPTVQTSNQDRPQPSNDIWDIRYPS